MKATYCILTMVLFLFLGCTNQKPKKGDVLNDSITQYIKLGGDRKLPYAKRMHYNEKVLPILLQQENDSLNRERLFAVGQNYFNMNNWNEVKKISRIVLENSRQKKDLNHIAKSYKDIGVFYENTSINDSAFYYYLKAEKIFKALKRDNDLCKIYIRIAQVKYYANDFLGEEKELIKALKIVRKANDKILELDVIYFFAQASLELKDFNKSHEYFKKALAFVKINKTVFDENDVSISMSCLGYNFFNSRNYKEAIFYFEESLKNKNLFKAWPLLFCQILDNLAHAKLKTKDYKEIEELHLKASKIRDSLHIDQGQNLNRLYLSEYYQTTNQIPKAQEFAHEAYSLSKSFRNAGDMLVCLKQLAKVDTPNALKYSQEYIRISDSMQQLERQTRNKFAKIAYETEEITTEKDEAVQQKWIFFGIAVLVIIIGGLVVLLLIQRAKQKELKFLQEQQKTNEEIYQLIQKQQTKIDEARETEKKRIAQDLHDGVMNRLSSTRLNLHILTEKATPEIIRKCLPFIASIQDIEKEIRNVSHDLNKEVFASNDGFLAILNSLLEEQKSGSNVKCHFEIDPTISWDLLESVRKVHLYRILQEALQNTQKHAQAQNIIVSLRSKSDAIEVEIYDDGVGFRPRDTKKGIGLQNIHARVKACQGTITIQSVRSTTIRIRIPIQNVV